MSARMSIPPSEAAPSGQSPADEPSLGAEDDWAEPDAALRRPDVTGETSDKKAAVNAVGVLLLVSYGAFILTDAISGQRAAGIAFWIVMLGVPSLYAVVSALGAGWRGTRDDELIKVATLAVELAAEQRRAQSGQLSADATVVPAPGDRSDSDLRAPHIRETGYGHEP
jgi:hypothetical protein